jgi:hypothetical protein
MKAAIKLPELLDMRLITGMDLSNLEGETMKKQALTMIALMVLVASLAASVNSQSLTSGKLVANIPFEFSAENQTFPAGEYIVKNVNPSSDKTILQISSRDGRHSLMLQMTSTHGKQRRLPSSFSIAMANAISLRKPGHPATRTGSRHTSRARKETCSAICRAPVPRSKRSL